MQTRGGSVLEGNLEVIFCNIPSYIENYRMIYAIYEIRHVPPALHSHDNQGQRETTKRNFRHKKSTVKTVRLVVYGVL